MTTDHNHTPIRTLTRLLAWPLRRRRYRQAYRRSLATDGWPAAQVRAYQDAAVQRVVRAALSHVRFYRERWRAAGLAVQEIACCEDLRHAPTVDKRDLLEHHDALRRPGTLPLTVTHHTTGGSTGTIATVSGPRGMTYWEMGCIHALWHRIGFRRGDRIVTLRGSMPAEPGKVWSHDRWEHRLTISTYHLRDDNVDEIARQIDQFAPKWLHVYPSAATLLANTLKRTGRRLGTRLHGVLCGSENVYPWQVDLFREVFDCATYAHYGHGEMTVLGGWCEKSRTYHFLPHYGYLELLDENQQPITEPGVTGEITGTGFFNTVMPLIRYRTADYGAWDEPGPCPACGRHHQRLARIEGRVQEYLTLADGTRFPATNINALHGMFFALIYRFQFVQDRPGHATLRYVPAVEMTPQREAEIRNAFAYLGELGLALDFAAVDEIPLTRSGKQRIVITEEPPPS